MESLVASAAAGCVTRGRELFFFVGPRLVLMCSFGPVTIAQWSVLAQPRTGRLTLVWFWLMRGARACLSCCGCCSTDCCGAFFHPFFCKLLGSRAGCCAAPCLFWRTDLAVCVCVCCIAAFPL